MEKIGVVVAADEKYAKIEIERESACGGNCASCGLCGTHSALVRIRNTERLQKGDAVRLIADDTAFLKRCALGYLCLTACMLTGGALGAKGGNLTSFIGAAAALCAGILLLRRFFSKEMNIKAEKIKR